jgi:photosystem II stability/assembly factor-like uncharacterized protein
VLISLLMASSGIALAAATPAYATSALGTGPWIWQNPRPAGNDLHDISCPSVNQCYATSWPPAAVLVTTNAGYSWSPRPAPGGAQAIGCPTSQNCFAGSGDNKLLHTTDGGWSWTATASPIPTDPTRAYVFNGISCPNTSTCVAVGSVNSRAYTGSGFILATSDSGRTWVDETPGQIVPLSGVACPSSTTCYAAGGAGALYVTKDGHTWVAQQTPVTSTLSQVSCPASNVCAVAGPGNQIITTVDGGAAWTVRTTNVSAAGSLTGIACPTVSYCIATGFDTHSTDDMIAVATHDGGLSWQNTFDPRTKGWLWRIACPSSARCVAVGTYGWIEATSDGGSTWSSPNAFGPSTPLHAVSCPSAAVCFATGDSGTILATTDGGRNWRGQASGTTTSLRGISCADTTHCMAVGLGGIIISTVDGGATWTGISSGTTQDLFAVSCPGPTHCVAGGGVVLVIDNGTVQSIPRNPMFGVYGVACPSLASCFLVGGQDMFSATVSYGGIQASADGGRTWSREISNDLNDLLAISCSPNTTACSAVDNFRNMVTSTDGVNWSLHTIWTGGYPRMDAVSCPSPGACLAVGLNGNMVSTPDGGATAQVQGPLTWQELFAVSCPTISVCAVVGDFGIILASGRAPDTGCPNSGRRVGILCRQPVISTFASHVVPFTASPTHASPNTARSDPGPPISAAWPAHVVDPASPSSALARACAGILERLQRFLAPPISSSRPASVDFAFTDR